MIRAYSVFIEEDLGSRTRLIGRMVHFRYNSENPCFLYGCCSHPRNHPCSTKIWNPESGKGNGIMETETETETETEYGIKYQ